MDIIKEGFETVWTTPTKLVRSPVQRKELRFGEVSIMSNSFSCLSDKGEKGEDIGISEEKTKKSENADVEISERKEEEKNLKTYEDGNKTESNGVNERMLRQSLPRTSKDGHKFLSMNVTQRARGPNLSNLNTCNSKNHH